jgi:hypothetical protein
MKGVKDLEGGAWSHSAPAVRGNRSKSRGLADRRLPITCVSANVATFSGSPELLSASRTDRR